MTCMTSYWKLRYNTIQIKVDNNPLEYVEEFCYLGSVLSKSGSCDKEVITRIAKASSAFKKMDNIWRDKKLALQVKLRLVYDSVVKTILLYNAETWPMSQANCKRLEAAHHRCLHHHHHHDA